MPRTGELTYYHRIGEAGRQHALAQGLREIVDQCPRRRLHAPGPHQAAFRPGYDVGRSVPRWIIMASLGSHPRLPLIYKEYPPRLAARQWQKPQ